MTVRFPHPLALLIICIALASVLTYIVPAGAYDRHTDPQSNRTVVVAGSYHAVPRSPVGVWQAIASIQNGLIAAASIIFFVFIVGGSFNVVERTGAVTELVAWTIGKFKDQDLPIIAVCTVFFAAGGFSFGMMEEVIAFIPMLILLSDRLGYRRLVAVAISYGAAILGATMSIVNPFSVGLGQTLAELPRLSGSAFRIAFFLPALAFYIWFTWRYAIRTRGERRVDAPRDSAHGTEPSATLGVSKLVVMGVVATTFACLVFGVLKLDWGLNDFASLFLVMAVVVGLAGRLPVRVIAEAFSLGITRVAYPAALIGFARAILVVLEQGQVIDTIIEKLFVPVSSLPITVAAVGMLGAHGLIHVPIPSWSGQALVTLPITIPLSDLIGLPRQVAVLAYQYGSGFPDLVVPTNGVLLAILAMCEVAYGQWLRFAMRLTLLLFAWAAVAIVTAILIGLK